LKDGTRCRLEFDSDVDAYYDVSDLEGAEEGFAEHFHGGRLGFEALAASAKQLHIVLDDRQWAGLVVGTFGWFGKTYEGRSMRSYTKGEVMRLWYAGRHRAGELDFGSLTGKGLTPKRIPDDEEDWSQHTVTRWINRVQECLDWIHVTAYRLAPEGRPKPQD
jgi:hypothetical protein